MNWFTSLFTKKTNKTYLTDGQQSGKRSQSLDYFDRAKESYFNKEKSEALLYFDKALELGFVDYFQNHAATFYALRASCLQEFEFHFEAINNFGKSIFFSQNDSNAFFSRSISKTAVLDYQGAISDLEKAIELSKTDDEQNKEYNNVAREQGCENGASDFYGARLLRAKMELNWELESIQNIENASSQNEKQYRQEMYDEEREKKLNRVKRR